jgi:hypothetical protein
VYIPTELKKNFKKNGNVFRTQWQFVQLLGTKHGCMVYRGMHAMFTKFNTTLTPTLIQSINLIIDRDHFSTEKTNSKEMANISGTFECASVYRGISNIRLP